MPRPLLLVDIDGVLNPHVRPSEELRDGYTVHRVGTQDVRLSSVHGEWLHRLSELFDIVWASTWEDDSNGIIGQLVGAPPNLPYLRFAELDPQGWTWKLPAVRAYVGDRPVAWLDDEPGFGAAEWAAQRAAPTQLITPDGFTGWSEAENRQLVEFACDANTRIYET